MTYVDYSAGEENSSEDESGVEILNSASMFPPQMKKYWRNRYRIFSKYDQGIIMTKELWYSVTPEDVSIFIAKFLRKSMKDPNGRILDLCCGGGGDTIQFLRLFSHVYGIDNKQIHLDCTLNNASVYLDSSSIQKKLKLMRCDWSYSIDSAKILADGGKPSELMHPELVNCIKTVSYLIDAHIDIVYSSPPWGGPSYSDSGKFNLEDLGPFGLEKLLRSILPLSNNIALFLPRNSNLDQLKAISIAIFGQNFKLRVLKISTNGHLKGLLCCWGDVFTNIDLPNAAGNE